MKKPDAPMAAKIAHAAISASEPTRSIAQQLAALRDFEETWTASWFHDPAPVALNQLSNQSQPVSAPPLLRFARLPFEGSSATVVDPSDISRKRAVSSLLPRACAA